MSVDASTAISMLQQFPARAHARLVQIMQKVGYDLQGWVQTQKLQGQVLHHRSGWLSSHVKPRVEDNGSSVTTVVGVDLGAVPYAGIHEYGFRGQETVKAHQRIITVCFGRPIEPTTVQVAAFTRTMNMPERSYLRSSLRDRVAVYLDWLRGVTR